MKFTKKLLITGLLSLCAIFTIQAQKPAVKMMNHEDRANKQSSRMIDDLELSVVQSEKVKAINLNYASKVKSLQKESKISGDRTGLKSGITALRKEQKEALNAVLTSEQAEKWAQIQANKPAKAPKKSKRRKFDAAKS